MLLRAGSRMWTELNAHLRPSLGPKTTTQLEARKVWFWHFPQSEASVLFCVAKFYSENEAQKPNCFCANFSDYEPQRSVQDQVRNAATQVLWHLQQVQMLLGQIDYVRGLTLQVPGLVHAWWVIMLRKKWILESNYTRHLKFDFDEKTGLKRFLA